MVIHDRLIVCRSLSLRLSNFARRGSRRGLSAAAPDAARPRLRYDRDTGLVYDAAAPSPAPLYQTVIGIEVHAQLLVPTKLFSSAPTRHHPASPRDAAANARVHAYDLAYPGALPSLSRAAVRAALLAAAALRCEIHACSRFERKHYFYPDLPHGYQITQQRWPLASAGAICFLPHVRPRAPVKRGDKKTRRRGGAAQDQIPDGGADSTSHPTESKPVQLRIDRIQIEQDTGKTTTQLGTDDDGHAVTRSYIDYNRAGCALVEIVSHPDLRSAHEAAGAVERIRTLLQRAGACDGKMEEGSLRCDVNVSIAPVTEGERSTAREDLPPRTGHRVEVKNLNSLRQIVAATEFEALRQAALAPTGAPTGQETRTFRVQPTSETHPLGGETVCLRAKGGAVDYRFLPEPDLPPLRLDAATLGTSLEDFLARHLPEGPEEARARLVERYALTEEAAAVIAGDPPAVALFERAVAAAQRERPPADGAGARPPEALAPLVASWLCNDLFALVKHGAANRAGDADEGAGARDDPTSVAHSPVDGTRLGALVALVARGALTTAMAKKVLRLMFAEGGRAGPREIADREGWRVVRDRDALVRLCEGVVRDPRHAAQLAQYRLGGKKVWKMEKFFAGRSMAASKGNADPERMKEALTCVLENLNS